MKGAGSKNISGRRGWNASAKKNGNGTSFFAQNASSFRSWLIISFSAAATPNNSIACLTDWKPGTTGTFTSAVFVFGKPIRKRIVRSGRFFNFFLFRSGDGLRFVEPAVIDGEPAAFQLGIDVDETLAELNLVPGIVAGTLHTCRHHQFKRQG